MARRWMLLPCLFLIRFNSYCCSYGLLSLSSRLHVTLSSSRGSFLASSTLSMPLSLSYTDDDGAYSSITTLSQQQQQRYLSSSSSSSSSSCSNTHYDGCVMKKNSFWIMGKGDGKKKRPKKKTTVQQSSLSSSSSSSSMTQQQQQLPQPQRVSTDINIPIRHQIRWGQMKKEAAKSVGQSFRQPKVVRTRYRRTWDEEEVEMKKEERKRKGQDPNWDIILNQTASQPLLIVDGYNIIHKWPRLKKHMTKGDTARARQLLIDDLESLRTLKGWRIECVFDGGGGGGSKSVGPLGHGPGGSSSSSGTGKLNRATKDVSKYGVRIVYTSQGIEADAYIEQRCSEAKNVTQGAFTRSFIVATDDGMIRMAGFNAGAMCMSAQRFVEELKAVKQATAYRVEVAMSKVNGEAIRPEKLRGTTIRVGSFGRNSILIEDKRNQTKRVRKKDIELLPEDIVNVTVQEDENGIPWWAQVPNRTKF